MNKKIWGTVLVACIGITIGGCKADSDDVAKHVNKMSQIITEDKIFDKDYLIEGSLITITTAQKRTNYLLKKDGNVYYTEFNDESGAIKYWIESVNDKYNIYYSDGQVKSYNEVGYDEIEGFLNNILNMQNTSININLRDIYSNVINEIRKLVESCKDNENIICEVDKNVFGKLTFNVKTQLNNNSSSEIEYTLKKGKLMRVDTNLTLAENSIFTELEIDYGKQKISLPNKDDYT